MSTEYVQFNVNEYVKVKFHDIGYKRMVDDCNKYNKILGKDLVDSSFFRAMEDKDGYFEIQLWQLMQRFGDLIGMGFGDLPFETTILMKKSKCKSLEGMIP